jgi:hypothetical protein
VRTETADLIAAIRRAALDVEANPAAFERAGDEDRLSALWFLDIAARRHFSDLSTVKDFHSLVLYLHEASVREAGQVEHRVAAMIDELLIERGIDCITCQRCLHLSPRASAHRYEGSFIGDECWDRRFAEQPPRVSS